jgi:DNA replication protein DnaC
MKSINEILANQNSPDELKRTLANYDHISLTEQEMDIAILRAKIQKERLLEDEERKNRAEMNRKALTATKWDISQTKAFAEHMAVNRLKTTLVVDAENQVMFDFLAMYFSRDQNFHRLAAELDILNPSLDKGLLFCGNPGTGKTFLMKVFARNQRQCFQVISASQIANHYQEHGSIDVFVELEPNALNDASYFFQPYRGLCIDDLGSEEVKNHFGSKSNVMAKLLEEKYSRHLFGDVLHATTNLGAGELREVYGDRVISRMREIFNFVVFDGADRRK